MNIVDREGLQTLRNRAKNMYNAKNLIIQIEIIKNMSSLSIMVKKSILVTIVMKIS